MREAESHPLRHSFRISGLGSFLIRFPKTSSIRLKKSAHAVSGIERTQPMGISKYTLYEYVKVDGTWRYCKAAFHENAKINPDVVFVDAKQGLLEKHPEGRYYMSHNGGWIDAGTDALDSLASERSRRPPQLSLLANRNFGPPLLGQFRRVDVLRLLFHRRA